MNTGKKIRTNDVVEWTIVDKNGRFECSVGSRSKARFVKNQFNAGCCGSFGYILGKPPFRIAKTVVTK